MNRLISLLVLFILITGPVNAKGDPIRYDFEYDVGIDVITGSFLADIDAGVFPDYVDIYDYSFEFFGVVFDALAVNITGSPDSGIRMRISFTPEPEYLAIQAFSLTSTTNPNAYLHLETCPNYVDGLFVPLQLQCAAWWEGIPDLADSDGRLLFGPSVSVQEATAAVPEPSTIALLTLGLFSMVFARRQRQT